MADNKVSVRAELENYTQIEKKLRSLEAKPIRVKIQLDGLDIEKQLSGQLNSLSGKINQLGNQFSQNFNNGFNTTKVKPEIDSSGFIDGASSLLDSILQINEGVSTLQSVFKNASWLKGNFDQPQTIGCPGFPIFPGWVYHGEEYAIMAA